LKVPFYKFINSTNVEQKFYSTTIEQQENKKGSLKSFYIAKLNLIQLLTNIDFQLVKILK